MTPKQVELHDTAVAAAGQLAAIAQKRPLTPSEHNRLMAALQSARMACDAAGLVDKETQGSPKIDELGDILDEVCLQSGLKAVVFSEWKTMIKMVETRLRRMGIGYVILHGGVPTGKRGALMDRFREDDGVQVFLSTDAGGVGLNLQSGSVLINLDVPWNPAVLEQRNARIHRLGQSKTVQVITMVAANSYEEHVLSLVQGKQDLFDNVIAEDAELDVVGMSKKLVDSLIEDLNSDKSAAAEEEDKAPDETPPDRLPEDSESMVKGSDDGLKKAITACIDGLQQAFGPRIERILGSGQGLLAVLDQVGSEDDRVAVKLSQQIPVVLIDQRTLAGLERLGSGSPVADATTYYDGTGQREEEETDSRLILLAREKLKAARVLLEQNCGSSAVELLVSALLAAAADRAGRDIPVSVQDAGVWLHGEALPANLITDQEAALIMRALSLAQAPSIPDALLAELSMDVEAFIQGESRG